MSAFWVTFSSGPRAMCVEGKDEAAVRERAKSVGTVAKVETLPYPAEPRMAPYEELDYLAFNPETKSYEPSGKKTICPPLCYKPQQCAGRTACPQRYSCSE